MTALAAPVAAAPVAKEEPVWDLFFLCDKPKVMQDLDPFLTKDVGGIVASYVVGKEDTFGPEAWKRYFGVDVGEVPRLPEDFYAWWFSQDPVEPDKPRCQTHLPPVLRPSGISLKKLGELVKAPKEGRPSKFLSRTGALEQNEKTQAGFSSWLVMSKDVFERSRSYDVQKKFIEALNAKTRIGYEIEPSAIDLATVVFARYVSTGERHLGDPTGNERRWTYSRTKEIDKSNKRTYPVAVGGFAPGGLYVCNYDHGYKTCGIAGLRKF